MKRIITTFIALAFSAAFITTAEARKAAGGKAKEDLEATFTKKDTNSDGFLSKEEFTAGAKNIAKAEKAFAKKDKDGDGKLSKEEFMAPCAKKSKKTK